MNFHHASRCNGNMADEKKAKQTAAKDAAKSAAPKDAQAPKAKSKEKAAAETPAARIPPRLMVRYRQDIAPTLMKEFNYANVMQVPQLKKIVVNIGLGEALSNAKALDAAVRDVATITGQKPVVRKAKKSIATFKLREGNSIGVKVTLRGDRMYWFLDRLMNAALPRVRDFRGVPPDAFDGRGNYTLGLREQLIFPEVDYDSIDKLRGMEITIVTSAKNDEEARRLLQLMGMPFRQK